ncbi:type I-E CRISPR-associated protein Cse2/CasB [Streptacidiphilus sp. N1-10]|uniref:Type I-E CRISPR-associated protein Cse2/CasB n=1 Tax=Streptacidiphilus jeojiensis TaxID=3229225 RepID=A0ABV6XXX5_9ACTN
MSTETAPTTPLSAQGTWLQRCESYMATVRGACSSPGGRADLRSGLADNFTSRWPLYQRLYPQGGIPAAQSLDAELPFLLIAALYAEHDAPNPRMDGNTVKAKPHAADASRNLGWSYARAVDRKAMRQRNAADALSALAQTDTAGLHRDLPGVVSELRSAGIPVDWAVLLRDVTRWPQWADQVRLDWARAFYLPATNKETTK